ncbi:GNAT family N-acetyltransferase [Pseudanabaenaceae cyanobacterium LEGE 13415]|nr:GNAT family N-acetyltransferase [Pseudanabaenaceae cyanobacterium LEGE 13415]
MNIGQDRIKSVVKSMNALQITRLDDPNAALEVVKQVVEQFVLPTLSEEGKETFPVTLAKNMPVMFSDANVEIFGMQTDQGLAGYIAVGRKTHIHHLFVRADQQQKGIGRMLIDFVEQRSRASNIPQLTVRASLNAVPFYEKCGFETTADTQEINGIKFQPMQKPLQS